MQLVRAKVCLRCTAEAWLADILRCPNSQNCWRWALAGASGSFVLEPRWLLLALSNLAIELLQAPLTLACIRSSYSWQIELCSRIAHPIGVQLPEINAPSLQSPYCSITSPRLLRFEPVEILLTKASGHYDEAQG
jgi:hypothetical protein